MKQMTRTNFAESQLSSSEFRSPSQNREAVKFWAEIEGSISKLSPRRFFLPQRANGARSPHPQCNMKYYTAWNIQNLVARDSGAGYEVAVGDDGN
jgi:hypothetical protein